MTRDPGTRVDHYELLGHVGNGGQAEVHRAKDLRDGSEVVIKFPLERALDHPVLAARWRREVAITEGLAHPRIAARRDTGERHREPYVVLDYASGGTLRDWVTSPGNALPVGQAVVWGRQLAEALAYLHGRGILHRDLKPENVLLTADSSIKLADFGSATRTQGGRHRFGIALPAVPEGTAEYLSPEQITAQPNDERSDIYGWGVVMYELLTGQVPFSGPDPWAAMQAHLRAQPLPVRMLRPDVPPALEAVVMTAMRRQPEHRYTSAAALLRDLDHLDSLDPATFDLEPEPAVRLPVGGNEAAAVLRVALAAAVGFMLVAGLAIALTALLH